jgi:S1-C subfamily serine protease
MPHHPQPPRPWTVAWQRAVALLAWALLAWPAVHAEGQADPTLQARALERAQRAVLGVQAVAVEDARSARTLGRARSGSGVLIDRDGLVLTIGYLVLEAEQVMLTRDDGRPVPARVLAYDLATGFGLVQALVPLGLEPAPLGRADGVDPQAPLMVASGGDDGAVSVAQLVARRPFSGYWEYHIDDALFTAPPRRDHSGAGLFNAAGELVGIGSLLVADAAGDAGSGGARRSGNMFVPVDLLVPILADLKRDGIGAASRRAWLGLNCAEVGGQLRVVRVTDDSPADVAGLEVGDRILRIDGTEVASLAALWQALWTGGAPERAVQLLIERGAVQQPLTVHSVDRMKTLRRSQGI